MGAEMGNWCWCVYWTLAPALSVTFTGGDFLFSFSACCSRCPWEGINLLSAQLVLSPDRKYSASHWWPKQCTSPWSIYVLPGYLLSNISTLRELRKGKDLVFIRAFILCMCSVYGLSQNGGMKDAEKARILPTTQEVRCRNILPRQFRGIILVVSPWKLWRRGFLMFLPVPVTAFARGYQGPQEHTVQMDEMGWAYVEKLTPNLLMVRLGDWYLLNRIMLKAAELVACWGQWRCPSQRTAGEQCPECRHYGPLLRISSANVKWCRAL